MRSRKISAEMISRMSKQSIKAGRTSNLFVIVTIILAAALLTVILMFAAGQRQQTRRELSHRQQVSYYNLTPEQLELLKKDERIARQIQVKTGVPTELKGVAVLPAYVSELTDSIQVGELESGQLPEAENQVAAEAALLEKMGVEPQVGNSITFPFYDGSRETFTVCGILKSSGAAKQYPVFFSRSYAENGSQLKEMPYKVYASLYNATNLSAGDCKEAMLLIGQEAGIERKNIDPSKAFLDSLSVNTQEVLLYSLVGAVILLACMLVIYGVFYLSVIGRIHQFGQLRTVGMTRRQMKKLVSREGGVLYGRSAPFGVAVGIIGGYFLIPKGFHIGNACLIAAAVLAVIYGVTMISVHKPAKIAAAVSPMEALRYVPRENMKKAENKRLCRKLTPLGLGIMNFSRNKKKTAITFASLALGGILFMTASSYISSFDREGFARQGFFTDAEFYIYYTPSAIQLNENGMSGLQAEAPLDGEMIREITALEGVKKVTEIKDFGVRFDYPQNDEYNNDDRVYLLSGEEMGKIDAFLEEGSADYDKLMSGNYCLAAGNDVAREIYGWQFAVGDTVTFHYYDSSAMAEKEVTILGILNKQYTIDSGWSGDGWFLMPEQAVLGMVSYDWMNSGLLVSVEEEKEEEIGDALARMTAERSELGLETLAERRIAYKQNADQLFGAISGLAVFIMTFSILSMINTLITNIVTRKQELAMLASIGMRDGQIRGMLLGESLLLAVVTVGVTMTAGTLCGCGLSHMLYKTGAFYMAFRFPTALALAYTGVLLLVPLAITFASLHSFSREALVERLRGREN